MKGVYLGKVPDVVLVMALNIVVGSWDFAACIHFPPLMMIVAHIFLGLLKKKKKAPLSIGMTPLSSRNEL